MSFDRKKMRESLVKRSEESAARSDGDSNQKYFRTKDESSLPLWKAKPTKTEPHIIDVLPFVAGDNFPLDGGIKIIKKGDYAYVLNIAVHQNVGALKEMVVCPAKNYGKPCPICEDFDKRSRSGEEWDTLKTIAPKDRSVYNVMVMDDAKTEAKGVQIWEVAHNQSEKFILAIAKNPRGGGYIPFQHPDADTGQSIAFEVDDDTYWTPKGHKFVKRDYNISDETLDTAYCLDELIMVLPYDKIKAKYYGTAPKDDAPDFGAIDEGEASGKFVEEHSHSRKRATEPTEVANNMCPFSGKFGIDIDKLPQCPKECPEAKYQDCAKEADRLEEEAKAAAAKAGGIRRRS